MVRNTTRFLVIYQHSSGDVPVGLFREKENADACCEEFDFDSVAATFPAYWDQITGIPLCLSIVTFEDGQPTSTEVVRKVGELCDS